MSAYTEWRDSILRAALERHLRKYKSLRKAAKELGLDRRNFKQLCERLRVRKEAA